MKWLKPQLILDLYSAVSLIDQDMVLHIETLLECNTIRCENHYT